MLISICVGHEELEEEICSVFPTMTYQQRLIGCLSCYGLGFFLSFGSFFKLMQLLAGNPVPFAIMYTLGNILSLLSTCFMFGPWAQAKKMFSSNR